jgi:hypothetical protein
LKAPVGSWQPDVSVGDVGVVWAGTVTVWVVRAAEPPLQEAVWPVKIAVVEQPASSVTVSVTV